MGTLSLLSGFVEQGLWPPRVRAAGKSNPRGTARNCIVVEAAGAISHTDTFDFKENAGTQSDFDVRQIRNDLYLSHRLFPELSSEMDKVAVVRSFWSHEVVHFRGEYYTRAGRPLNPAQVSEIPPVGSVVSYELEPQRRETDTFPTFVTCNLGSAALPSGFLHPRFSGLDINAQAGVGSGRWPRALELKDEDRRRYGENAVGLGCLLARNLIRADAGTRYVHVKHPGWDHHKNIFDHSKKSNHYKHCTSLDRALANLLRDLGKTPSPHDPEKTLLDDTIVAVPTEFGRVPGPLNGVAGRHHYNRCYIGLFAGGGVIGGRIIGRTDAAGENATETGWKYGMQPKTENIYASVYSALGIDWRKEITNTPSKRVYRYVDPLGATEPCIDDEIAELFV